MEKSYLLKYLLSLILITGDCDISTTGMVTLSPTSVAPVCRVGDPLELTCISSGSFLRWVFIVSNEQGIPQEYGRSVNSQDGSQQMSTIELNSTTFTYMRTSDQRMVPLISTLVIDSVNRYLNGTEVYCLDLATSTNTSTTIHLFDMSPSEFGPILVTSEEEFGADNVTVTVEWTQEEGATYQLIIVPQIPIISTGDLDSSIQLILPYNTNYNLSVKSALPCQHQAQSHVLLFYANCGYPLLSADNESKPNVTYNGLPIQGATVNFTCRTGLALSGSNTATCMGNGEWEPDPQELECIKIFNCDAPSLPPNGYIDSYNHTAEGLAIYFSCTNRTTCFCPDEMEAAQNVILHTAVCLLDGHWEPNLEDFCSRQNYNTTKSSSDINAITVILATLVAILLISNAFLFITGYICGLRCKKMDTQPATLHDIVHEDLELPSTGVDEQEFELESNVAYGHFQSSQGN